MDRLFSVMSSESLMEYQILYRGESVSASQDGVKCSVSRDHGSEVHFETLPSDRPGTPPLHNDAFTASDILEEGGVCSLFLASL